MLIAYLWTTLITAFLVGMQWLHSYTGIFPNFIANLRASFPIIETVDVSSEVIYIWPPSSIPMYLELQPSVKSVIFGLFSHHMNTMKEVLKDGVSIATLPSEDVWNLSLLTGTPIVPILPVSTPSLYDILGLFWIPFRSPITFANRLPVSLVEQPTANDIETLQNRYLAALQINQVSV